MTGNVKVEAEFKIVIGDKTFTLTTWEARTLYNELEVIFGKQVPTFPTPPNYFVGGSPWVEDTGRLMINKYTLPIIGGDVLL